MWDEVLKVDSTNMAVNYGLNKVRFTNPVPADGRVRLNATLQVGRDTCPRVASRSSSPAVIELEGSDRPAVVAEAVYRMFE